VSDEPDEETDTAQRTEASTRRAVESKNRVGFGALGAIARVVSGRNKRGGRAMQVSRTNELKGGRTYHSIGRIKASSGWRAGNGQGSERARLEALWALVSEAQEFYADAVIDLSFEVEAIRRPDFDGAPLRRIAATGVAVRFAEAA